MTADNQTTGLFGELPDDPAPLNHNDAELLRNLPRYPMTRAIDWDLAAEAQCRRLQRRGLVRLERHKDDPIAIRPTMYVGKMP